MFISNDLFMNNFCDLNVFFKESTIYERNIYMKILTPVNTANEVELLKKAGAEEFFCGYVPYYWIKKYNKSLYQDGTYRIMQISNNKRDGISQNITDINNLKELADKVREVNCKLYVTLNFFFYPQESYEELNMILDEIKMLDISGVIITDVGLINYIRNNYPDISLVLSTCQSIYNSYAVKFFKEMGITRITFPRHITLDEIIEITNAEPNIEYECFILEGKCIYDDGNCKALHGVGNFCCDQWEYSYYRTDDKDFTYKEIQKLSENELCFKNWTKPYPSVDAKVNGWPYVGCGICAIPQLIKQSNITTLKISGRGITIGEKLSLIRYVKRAISMAENGKDAASIREYGKKVLGIPEMCDLKSRCYLTV